MLFPQTFRGPFYSRNDFWGRFSFHDDFRGPSSSRNDIKKVVLLQGWFPRGVFIPRGLQGPFTSKNDFQGPSSYSVMIFEFPRWFINDGHFTPRRISAYRNAPTMISKDQFTSAIIYEYRFDSAISSSMCHYSTAIPSRDNFRSTIFSIMPLW